MLGLITQEVLKMFYLLAMVEFSRIVHHSLCSVELSEFLKTPVDTLEIHAHFLGANLIKILSKLPEQAEKQHPDLFDPLIHP